MDWTCYDFKHSSECGGLSEKFNRYQWIKFRSNYKRQICAVLGFPLNGRCLCDFFECSTVLETSPARLLRFCIFFVLKPLETYSSKNNQEFGICFISICICRFYAFFFFVISFIMNLLKFCLYPLRSVLTNVSLRKIIIFNL